MVHLLDSNTVYSSVNSNTVWRKEMKKMRVLIVFITRVKIQMDHNLTNNTKLSISFPFFWNLNSFFFTQALVSTFQQYQGYWDNIYLKVMRLTLRVIHKWHHQIFWLRLSNLWFWKKFTWAPSLNIQSCIKGLLVVHTGFLL